ncbi:MAG: Gfo/Idh/MocA family protein [Acidimicrobiales bacterium]
MVDPKRLRREDLDKGEPVGFGVLGCGSVGPLHAEAVAGLEGARLIGVADIDGARSATVAERWHVESCRSLGQLLCLPGLDIVCVCTPSGTHAELGMEIAASGRHVVIEKPIDVSLDAARRLLAVCERSGVALSVISQHRFDPGITRTREALVEGHLGTPIFGEARAWWYRTQGYYDADNWRGTHALDGGALMNQGIHLVDLLLWLFGPVDGVFAQARTVAHEIEAEDLLTTTLRFRSGALGTISVSTAAYPGRAETLLVVTTKGTVELGAGEIVSWQLDTDTPLNDVAAPGDLGTAATGSRGLAVTSHRAQLAEVANAARSGRRPAVTGEDGLAALAVVRAAYESAATGVEIRPEPVSAST